MDLRALRLGIRNIITLRIKMKNSGIKRFLSFVLCITLLLSIFALPVYAVTISDTVLGEDTDYIYGYYRRYVHWSIVKSEQTLRIFGNKGEEYDETIDSSFYYTHHIARFTEYIKILEVEGKIRSIEEGALAGLPFERVEIGNGLKRIEKDAFKDCAKLEKIVIPASVEYIGKGAFDGCESLERVYIFADNIIIDEGAFPDSLNIKAVYFYGDNIEIRSGNGEFKATVDGFLVNGDIIPMLVAAAVTIFIVSAYVFLKRISKKEAKEKGELPDRK